MTAVIDSFSSVTDEPHEVRLFSEGAQQGSEFVATSIGTGTYAYTFTVPNTTPAGSYSFALYEIASGRLRSQGNFLWDGADIVVSGGSASALTPEQSARLVNIEDILEADEIFNSPTATKYKRGTGQSVVLLQKTVTGSTCVDSVTLTE